MIGSRATTASACRALLQPPGADVFRLRTRVPGRHRKIKLGDWRQPWLRVAGALLLVVSACIHLGLYLTGYRSIPTIGWLFLVQAVVAFILAVGALVTHSRLVAVAGAAFALSTLGCYLLAVWIGLFGFREIRTRAGPGITGKLGTIRRPGGSAQATYDGHPLYTYAGDSAPGQARGNNLDLNGGFWYEVRA